MTLVQLSRQAPRSEALVRVYKNQVVINAAAAALLCLQNNDLVSVVIDKDAQAAGRGNRLYIGKVKRNAYAVSKRRKSFRICCTPLAKSMAEALEGYGTYRICPEDSETDAMGQRYYNIFFRKYHD
jgi:hypothetical protein